MVLKILLGENCFYLDLTRVGELKRATKMKTKELLSLKVYPLTLKFFLPNEG